MPDEPASPAAPESLDLPRVIPAGGSKWAHSFSGPMKVMVPDGVTTEYAGALVHPNGEVSADGGALEQLDADVFPLTAGAAISLAHFLAGPLAASIALAGRRRFNYCGARLTARQAEVLRKLGKADEYIHLQAPARFRSVISRPPGTPPFILGPHMRGLADKLRAAAAPIRRLVILPPRETERFSLSNRASLTAWLRARKLEIFEPEAIAFEDSAALLAAAALIILADPEQAGLLSLCAPGTRILEIAPEGWLGADARYACQIFGLQWSPFLASAPAYPLLNALPFGARVPLSYEIPIRALAKTLDALM